MKTKPTTPPSVNRSCTQTVASHCMSVLFPPKAGCLVVSMDPTWYASHRRWTKTKCNSHGGLTEGWQLHSDREQHDLPDQGLKLLCGMHSSAACRPAPSATIVRKRCRPGTWPIPRNSVEGLPHDSTGHRRQSASPLLEFPHNWCGFFSLLGLQLSRCRGTTPETAVRR